jgi:LysM repeat protein
LLEANPAIDPTMLAIGQVICIPLATPPVTCPAGTTAYTIQAGDTFYAIARRYGTTVAALQQANPGVDPNSLLVGQVICVPG